jgi:CspA family cold shock protein
MAEGTIKTLTDRGFGFIQPDAGRHDIFFHRSALAGGLTFEELRQGDRVSFTEEDDPRGKGARAADVRRASAG